MNTLLIEKQTGGYFKFTLNEDTANAITSIQNDLLAVGNQLHFKTGNGANIIKEQFIYPADVTIVAGGTFTFTTVAQVWDKLIDIDYFAWLGGGGGGGVDRFDDLLDTFQYTGNAGKAVVVDNSELRLVPITLYNKRLFTELEDTPSSLLPNKMLVVNPSGTAVVLQDQPQPPEQFLNSVGYFDYNDLITQTVPLAVVANVPKKLTNDTEGANTSTDQNPYGVSYVWDYTTNQFNFTELEVGDTIDVRIHVQVTTTSSNQKVSMSAKFGIGSVSEFTNSIYENMFKSAGTHEVSFVAPFYMGSTYITDYPAELYLTSDATATVKVDGWYVRILRKNINIITVDYQVPEATTLAKGIVRLAGDLSGTANNPTVPELANKVPTSRTVGTTSPLLGGGALSSNLTLSIQQANSVDSGYLTYADWGRFDEAHRDRIVSAAVTGTTTKTLTLTQHDAGTITTSWTDDNTDAVSSVFGRTGAVVAVSGDYTTSLVTESTNKNYQTDNQKLYNDATSSIQTQLNSKQPNLSGSGIVKSTGGTISYLTDNTANWDDAYNNKITTAAVSGTATKTLTLTQQDGGTVTASWTDKGDDLIFSSPLVNTAGTISIPSATGSVNGYLSSADWNTFNSKQGALNGTGFVKVNGTTVSYDNSTYALDSAVVKLTGDQTIAGAKTFSSNVTAPVFQLQPNNTVGSNPNYIGQQMATNDSWKIYGNTADLDKGEMVFELGDNAIPFGDSNGQRFRFHYDNSSNGTGKSPFILDYNEATFNANVTATSFIKSGGTSSQFLKANGSVDSSTYVPTSRTITINGTSYDLSSDRSWTISAGISGSGTTNYIPKFTGSSALGNSLIYDNGTNVGIGTTSPSRKLEVASDGSNWISGTFSGTGNTNKVVIGNLTTPTIGGHNAALSAWTDFTIAGDSIIFSPFGSEKMRINGTGNVGIGTTSPGNKLHTLVGNNDGLRVESSNSGFIELGKTSGSRWRFQNDYNVGDAFELLYGASGAAPTNSRLIVTSGGNVGIGTTSPSGRLTIQRASSGAETDIDFLNEIGAGGAKAKIRFGGTNEELGFWVGSPATERMRISSGGDVLIGTETNPGSGNYKTAIVTGGYDGLYISVNQSPGGHAIRANRNGDGDLILFSRNGTNVGAIAVSSGGTGYYTSSDYRLKQDFKQFKGLDLISKIKVYDYEWKSNKTRSYGVIAHELQQVINYVVTGNKDDEEMQSVDYSKIVPILIASIQELKVEIENLKYKI